MCIRIEERAVPRVQGVHSMWPAKCPKNETATNLLATSFVRLNASRFRAPVRCNRKQTYVKRMINEVSEAFLK